MRKVHAEICPCQVSELQVPSALCAPVSALATCDMSSDQKVLPPGLNLSSFGASGLLPWITRLGPVPSDPRVTLSSLIRLAKISSSLGDLLMRVVGRLDLLGSH